MQVYLAGAMEHAPDRGCGWREEMSRFLTGELNHRVFNPCVEELQVLTPEEHRHLHEWKTSDPARFRQAVRKLIEFDIHHLLNHTDYIICLWDQYVLNGGGTHGELTMAYHHRIPVYMVHHLQRPQISSWIIGCTSEMFEDFSLLKDFLKARYGEDV